MGSTGTDIYIKRNALSQTDFRELLVQYYRGQGYEMSNGKDESGLTVYVVWNDNADWIAIKSSYLEDINTVELKAITRDLRRVFGTEVMLATIVDSDICLICFADLQQREVKLFVSDPGSAYRGLYPPAAAKNNIGKLKPLLIDPGEDDTLQKVWASETVFAEEKRDDVLGLFGIGQNMDSMIESESISGVLEFHFCAVEDFAKGYRVIEDGLPKFEPRGEGLTIMPGSPYATGFLNSGGPSTGLSFILYGDLIEKSIKDEVSCFEVSSVDAWWHTEKIRKWDDIGTAQKFEQSAECKLRRSRDHYYYQADFPDFRIPPGLIITQHNQKTYNMIFQYCIMFRFTLFVKNRNDDLVGDIYIAVAPHENWDGGQSSVAPKFLRDVSHF